MAIEGSVVRDSKISCQSSALGQKLKSAAHSFAVAAGSPPSLGQACAPGAAF